MADESISISVVFALADFQDVVKLRVEQGTTVENAVRLSGLAQKYLKEAAPLSCAIFSRIVEASEVVSDGDRIEILRPLMIDPKENRRQLAAKNRPKR